MKDKNNLEIYSDIDILFFPQNWSQLKNFVLIAKEMLTLGKIDINNIRFLIIENAFDDPKLNLTHEFEEIRINWKTKKPIYEMNFFHRLCNILYNVRAKRKLRIFKNSVLVAGNDGVLQRYVINSNELYKRYIVCETIIGPQKQIYRLYRYLFLFGSFLKISHFMPGLSFHSRMNGIFLNNSSSKSLLLERFVRSKIYVSEMPIQRERLDVYYENKTTDLGGDRNLLYIASAYSWHRKFKDDKNQINDIRDLITFFSEKEGWNVRIRVHPRDDRIRYTEIISGVSNIELSNNCMEVDDLAWSSHVVTAGSSLAVDAKMMGKRTFMYRRNFGPFRAGAIFNHGFKVINDFSEIADYNADPSVSLFDEAPTPIAATIIQEIIKN